MHMRKIACRLAMIAGFAFTAQGCTTASDAGVAGATAVQGGAGAQVQTQTVSPQQLVDQVRIPFETFTLDNGLRVVVHEDRKAPVVAVSIWYNVGSKDEPAGRTGFAHLFEHLMFNGSEHAPGDYFQYTRAMGATDLNGTTWFDRTNYFQTVPRPALEQALFLESDRMGHLLGAVTQAVLDEQRVVVQNEKRQGDNQPFGLVEYAQLEALFPEGHPYRHSTIGSMEDLDSASLQDVQTWFRDNYGPNNAVLVLAGDINVAEARPLVERYFGAIPRGPVNTPAAAAVPTLQARVDQVMTDRVANTRLYRNWVVPGLTDEDLVPLMVGAQVFGGLASSRLDNELVRGDQSAIRVTTNVQPFQRVSIFEVMVDVRPGQDADAVSRRLDQLMTDYIANGPTADEVQRAVMQTLAGRIRGLEQVGGFGGKAVALAEGMLYADDPNFYHTRLQQLAAVTPDQVRTTMQRWLNRPVYALRINPGERGAYEESSRSGGVGTMRPRYYRQPEAGEQPLAPLPIGMQEDTQEEAVSFAPRSFQREMPRISGEVSLDFPDIERARLSNGIEVVYARRTTVPVTRVAVEFDAGIAADPADRLGTQALMLNLMDEGTTTLSSVQIAETEERLGADVSTGASLDRTAIALSALTPNLGASLDLLADVVRNPAFAPNEVERLRRQQLAGIAQEMTQPQAIALRALPPLLFGQGHPYGKPFTGSGDPQALATVTRDHLVAFHQAWIRPDNAQIFVVSDLPLAQITPLLEARFGNWQAPAVPRGTKTFGAAADARPRIILINRPQSPQSLILGGAVLPVRGDQDLLPLMTANDVLGGDFSARINMELRERRGWSYGAYGFIQQVENQVPYIVLAPVQTDRTGDSLRALREQISNFLTTQGVTSDELGRTILGNVRELPGSFETGGSVLGALRSIELYDRPDNYYDSLPERYRGMTQQSLDQAARQAINPQNFVWVVVGDAAQVRPQLEGIGLPIEEMNLDGSPVAGAAGGAQ